MKKITRVVVKLLISLVVTFFVISFTMQILGVGAQVCNLNLPLACNPPLVHDPICHNTCITQEEYDSQVKWRRPGIPLQHPFAGIAMLVIGTGVLYFVIDKSLKKVKGKTKKISTKN